MKTLYKIILLCVFVCSPSWGTAIALDSTTGASGGFNSSLTATLTTHGTNREIVIHAASTATGAFTGASGGGLTWALAPGTATKTNTGIRGEIWVAFAATQLTSQTITFSYTASTVPCAFTMDSFSGVDTTTPVETTTSAAITTATDFTVAVTPTQNNAYVACYGFTTGSLSFSQGTGYTLTSDNGAAVATAGELANAATTNCGSVSPHLTASGSGTGGVFALSLRGAGSAACSTSTPISGMMMGIP